MYYVVDMYVYNYIYIHIHMFVFVVCVYTILYTNKCIYSIYIIFTHIYSSQFTQYVYVFVFD